jgi:hypothetical protein
VAQLWLVGWAPSPHPHRDATFPGGGMRALVLEAAVTVYISPVPESAKESYSEFFPEVLGPSLPWLLV